MKCSEKVKTTHFWSYTNYTVIEAQYCLKLRKIGKFWNKFSERPDGEKGEIIGFLANFG